MIDNSRYWSIVFVFCLDKKKLPTTESVGRQKEAFTTPINHELRFKPTGAVSSSFIHEYPVATVIIYKNICPLPPRKFHHGPDYQYGSDNISGNHSHWPSWYVILVTTLPLYHCHHHHPASISPKAPSYLHNPPVPPVPPVPQK